MDYKGAALSEQVHRFYSNTPNHFLPHGGNRMMIRKMNDDLFKHSKRANYFIMQMT